MFGAGGMLGGESEAPSSATAGGGPFMSGSVTIGKDGNGIGTQTMMIVGAVLLLALFLLKR